MCPSLIEIGSKTAEKNSAQTNRQTDKPVDTTKLMVTWLWTKIISICVQTGVMEFWVDYLNYFHINSMSVAFPFIWVNSNGFGDSNKNCIYVCAVSYNCIYVCAVRSISYYYYACWGLVLACNFYYLQKHLFCDNPFDVCS